MFKLVIDRWKITSISLPIMAMEIALCMNQEDYPVTTLQLTHLEISGWSQDWISDFFENLFYFKCTIQLMY